MTLEELLARESIRDTMASYNMAGDRLKRDDFVAVFTEDAVMETEGVRPEDSFRYEGKQAIAAWIERWGGGTDDKGKRAKFIRHHLSTSKIEFTGPGTAKARTYWVAYTDIGPDHCGYYLDTFRKVGERWLIAHRKVRMDWRSPDSLYMTAVARSR